MSTALLTAEIALLRKLLALGDRYWLLNRTVCVKKSGDGWLLLAYPGTVAVFVDTEGHLANLRGIPMRFCGVLEAVEYWERNSSQLLAELQGLRNV